MDVERYGHYVADGLVTHNYFYGWREGAARQFFGPNNATDVWAVKKVNPQSMIHLTEKPVELAKRAIEYSSRPRGKVLDLFGEWKRAHRSAANRPARVPDGAGSSVLRHHRGTLGAIHGKTGGTICYDRLVARPHVVQGLFRPEPTAQ
jgi:hypothetical protein